MGKHCELTAPVRGSVLLHTRRSKLELVEG